MFFKNKKEVVKPVESFGIPIVKNNCDEEDWVWVQGYKGVNQDMTPNYGNIIYNLKDTFKADGKIELCENGFHFSKSIRGVMHYRGVNYRIFKVECLVRKDDWDKELNYKDDQFVAKEIRFIEELDYDDFCDYIEYDFIKDKSDYELFVELNRNKEAFVKKYIYNNLNMDIFNIIPEFNEDILINKIIDKSKITKTEGFYNHTVISKELVDINLFNTNMSFHFLNKMEFALTITKNYLDKNFDTSFFYRKR